jgi:hypothetical protein
LNLAFDDRSLARAKSTYRYDSRAILVPQGKVKKNILHAAQAELAQRFGQRHPYASQRRYRAIG